MDVGDINVPERHPVPRHRLTLEQYHRLGEVGIFGEGDRVELLEGQLVDMSSIGPRHALAVDALTEHLRHRRRQRIRRGDRGRTPRCP